KSKVHRYLTPISQPLVTDEVMFECKKGRVTLLDTGALLEEIHRGMRDKAKLLQTQWQVADTTRPVGAFKLVYSLERERGTFDGPWKAGRASGGGFRYALTGWEAVPVREDRGETVEEALRDGSDYRRIVDSLDPQQTAVTFWVYPDSFALYRRLRDDLHRREVTVAGRPLPDGVPISSSRQGTTSRGQ